MLKRWLTWMKWMSFLLKARNKTSLNTVKELLLLQATSTKSENLWKRDIGNPNKIKMRDWNSWTSYHKQWASWNQLLKRETEMKQQNRKRRENKNKNNSKNKKNKSKSNSPKNSTKKEESIWTWPSHPILSTK